ncbi:Mbov_0121 family peptidase domain-containing ABC transporter [Mycoplasmopsis gallopavonis]|uniref:ABC transporter, ATP-binding protein n=1 Tax=Mycoplasmopsis gallopavonis TaxID=76629 RepID=A0A449AZY2_9BACT|nr:cysteine peptidase family C39 domain-containing protein [Mycoplasmopsis gallopavonis]RIV16625.1 ATP-binding cassette domain-containing protein [Mycoplasmopsis gallopavonis]VEU73061.1 ABC transporter, ATP-binding protein [Mycoplasmopsis gallopavonis]
MSKIQYDSRDCSLYVFGEFLNFVENQKVSIQDLKMSAFYQSNGISFETLQNLISDFGYDLELFNCEFQDFIQIEQTELPLACVVKNNDLSHLVLVYKIHKNKIYYYDPEQGKLKIQFEDFEKIFLNIVVNFKKSRSSKNNNPSNENLISLTQFEFKTPHFVLLFQNIIESVLIFSLPFLNKYVLSKIIPFYLQNQIIILFVLFCILLLITFLFKLFSSKYLNFQLLAINKFYLTRFIDNLSTNNFNLIAKFSLVELRNRLNSLYNLSSLYLSFWPNVISSCFSLVLAFLALHKINLFLLFIISFYAFSGLITSFLSHNLYRYKYQNLLKDSYQIDKTINNYFVSLKGNCDLLLKRKIYQDFNLIQNQFNEKTQKFQNQVINLEVINQLIEIFTPFFVVIVGSFLIWNNQMSLIELLFLMTAANLLTRPIKSYFPLAKLFFQRNKDLEILKIFNWEKYKNISGQNQVLKIRAIEINTFEYQYPFTNKIVLKIDKCILTSKHFLKSPNGSGKSTLAKILSGNLPYLNGEILINEKLINLFENNSYKEKVYLVDSNFLDLDLTIKEFLNFNCSNQEVWDFLTKTNLIELFKEMKIGTNLEMKLNNLSIGQQQFVKLVKLFAIEYDLIILDEAFENLSPKILVKLFELLKQELDKKIVLEISHHNRFLFENSEEIKLC